MGVGEKESTKYSDLIYVRNAPFECVPEGFILALKDKDYTYKDYLQACKLYNTLSCYWNILGYKDSKLMVVSWGTWDPLERHFRVLRSSSYPTSWKVGGEIMRNLLYQIRLYASELQAAWIWLRGVSGDTPRALAYCWIICSVGFSWGGANFFTKEAKVRLRDWSRRIWSRPAR
jgi:hypothetical protein